MCYGYNRRQISKHKDLGILSSTDERDQKKEWARRRFSYKVSINNIIKIFSSFAPAFNIAEMRSFSPGAGKSPSFFFFTSNKWFAVKTLKEQELRRLIQKGFLERYCEHLRKNPNSMLCRFYGVYKIKIKFQKVISVVVMDNIMGQNPEHVIRTYDLKGSTF